MIPEFTEQKLKQILHYTDLDANPSYDAFKSKEFYEIQSGAKGVSKSFGGAIISIYRLVNEKIFCSVWCRNQYNHIANTLRPMFLKVLSFLKDEHNLDYTEYITVTTSGVYWNFDDGGKGRCILFQNFEKTQAFQGITLPNNAFKFGELVIDEPIEDPIDTKKTPLELQQLYEVQEEKIPLLIQNTVLRTQAPDNFQIKVKFFYNIFTTEHFLIQKFHNVVLPILTPDGNPNNLIMEKLIKEHYIQKTDANFDDDLGITITMFAKTFVPKKELSAIQMKNLNSLKNKNLRLWIVTVAGFVFLDETQKTNYFLKPYIINNLGEIRKEIELVEKEYFYTLLKNNEIYSIWDGFDPGKVDNASWVRVALTKRGEILVLEAVEDIKAITKTDSRLQNCRALLKIIDESNKDIMQYLKNKNSFDDEEILTAETFNSVIACDNDIIIENLNAIASEMQLDNIYAVKANRRDTNKQAFGIVSRQNWEKFIFANGLIKLINSQGSKKLLENFTKQVIPDQELKRDESIFAEIYDLINAFEMACSFIYKNQYLIFQSKGE
ncbi:hypothetical protein RRG48_04940 [Mycoplasmopsis canis]|uniref:hypothetical protein n=1 Tax=Mycoplasmopsis cynos TaxID=171284 RepID=UPI002AFF81C4|nr:hypothetical protein [Mycoplasmopsis cynos]WQQ13451.1 hypothetical protein RRG58_01750 [Mycoplasmopsis cynos]WQQ13726.1 hypothetical protein RRG52_03160 [Mycoplasmopsis cynos]